MQKSSKVTKTRNEACIVVAKTQKNLQLLVFVSKDYLRIDLVLHGSGLTELLVKI